MTKIKSNGKIIDLSEWQTPAQYAKNHNIKPTTVRQWAWRVNNNGSETQPIESVYIQELNITLVRKLKSDKK